MGEQGEMSLEREVCMMSCNVLNELRFERKLCDVLIRVDGAEFAAHKAILCGCSQYFRCVFTNGWYPPDTYEYSIPNVSSEIMALILEYAYTQHVKITDVNVNELLVAADYLGVNDLVNKCVAILKAQCCVENCFSIWHFAHFYLLQKLEQYTMKYILHNFKEVVRVSKDFLDLTVKQLSEIIRNDELNVKKENMVFEAIVQWIEHAPQQREAHLEVLLPKVRMALMDFDYFNDVVKNNTYVAKNKACVTVLSNVLRIMYGMNPHGFPSFELMRPRLPSAVLLAIGGWSSLGPTHVIEAYDTRSERWVNMPCIVEHPRAYHGTAFLSGFVYCIGGFNNEEYFNSVIRFDPITRTWAQVGPMHSRRCYVSVCVLKGHIYAMGGSDGQNRLATGERYDPDNNQWTIIAPMHAPRSDASATVLDGKVYICGGFNGNEYLFTAEYYSPQTDQWTLITSMSSRRSGLGVITYEGHVYAVGGFDGFSRLRTAEMYDPQTNSWCNISNMISQRSNFGIEVVDECLFVAGGYTNFCTTSKVEFYDKETDEWQEAKDMEIQRSALSCCVLLGLPNMSEYSTPRDELPQSPGSSRGFLEDP